MSKKQTLTKPKDVELNFSMPLKINVTEFREQKRKLIEVQTRIANLQKRSKFQANIDVLQEEWDAVEGMIALCDAIQDHMVDVEGLDKFEVFNLEIEDEDLETIRKSLKRDEYNEFYNICEKDTSLLQRQMKSKAGTKGLVDKKIIELKGGRYYLTQRGKDLQTYMGNIMLGAVKTALNSK